MKLQCSKINLSHNNSFCCKCSTFSLFIFIFIFIFIYIFRNDTWIFQFPFRVIHICVKNGGYCCVGSECLVRFHFEIAPLIVRYGRAARSAGTFVVRIYPWTRWFRNCRTERRTAEKFDTKLSARYFNKATKYKELGRELWTYLLYSEWYGDGGGKLIGELRFDWPTDGNETGTCGRPKGSAPWIAVGIHYFIVQWEW